MVVSSSDLPLDEWISKVKECKLLDLKDINKLTDLMISLLFEEPNIVPVSSPAIVCGNIHGQFYDLLELFKVAGQIESTEGNYVFLGAYVDRGEYSVETFTYLMLLKARYPSRVTLLRSSHESRMLTQVYGFYHEAETKYGTTEFWQDCCRVFDYLPLAAIIDNRILCMNGGLSPEITQLDQIQKIKRNVEIPIEGMFTDIMWSDPEEVEGWQIAGGRGLYYVYGPRVMREFNHTNGLELLCRSRQLVMEGFRYPYEKDESVVSIWSAPNYCGRCGNVACVLSLDQQLNRTFKIFRESEMTAEPRRVKQHMSVQCCAKEE